MELQRQLLDKELDYLLSLPIEELQGDADEDEISVWMFALENVADRRWLSRYPRQRLSGEVIRDAMLSVAGVLNRKTGGPGIRPPLPVELRSTLLKDQWNVTEDTAEHARRSIYVFARRNMRFPIFEAFDRPAANQSCSRRNVSTTAPQALHLLNSEFTWQMAQLSAILSWNFCRSVWRYQPMAAACMSHCWLSSIVTIGGRATKMVISPCLT